MSNINNFDKIIKEKLGGFEEAPPAHLWSVISAGIAAGQIASIPFYKTAFFKIASLAASIAVVFGILWFYNSDNNSTENNTTKPITTSLQKNTIKNSPSNNTEKTIVQTPNTTTLPISTSNNKTIKIENEKVDLTSIAADKENRNTINNNSKIIPIAKKHNTSFTLNNQKSIKTNRKPEIKKDIYTIPKEEVNKLTNNEKIEAQGKNLRLTENNSEFNESKSVNTDGSETTVNKQEIAIKQSTEINKEIGIEQKTSEVENSKSNTEKEVIIQNTDSETKDITKKPETDFNPRTRNFDKFSIGAHYGIEFIKLSDINITANNIDLSFNYQNLNFIAQTGIGIQFSRDKNNYNTKYISNDYLATEYRFDSVTFVPDGNGGFTPKPVNPYYEDIYDSVKHVYNSDIYENYYSIRVPLLIGFQKSYRKIGLFAKGGIIYSHIVFNKTSELYKTKSNARFIESDYIGANRKSNQLQYVLAGGLSYAINKKLFFNAELIGKYYQYSLYENTAYDNINPWSFETRIGLTYLLN